MLDSPRTRRLRTDRRNLEALRAESSILDFQAHGDPADRYLVRFRGNGLCQRDATRDVITRDVHEVSIGLGASYPRTMPDLAWRTPIFHPNISASGVVCLGGYGAHWVPSVTLDELCEMLWDMIRYRNFDVESPYNREASWWAKAQSPNLFPLDRRSLRDRVTRTSLGHRQPSPPVVRRPTVEPRAAVVFADETEILDAELVTEEVPDILFLE